MAFDACFLSYVVRECDALLSGGRVEKIYQPGKDELILVIHRNNENRRLLINGGSQNPRLQITEERADNPSVPPMFCMMLRKHLNLKQPIIQDSYLAVQLETFVISVAL